MMPADADAKAPLELMFEAEHGRTILASRHVSYPFNVTAPLRPLGSRARVIVQSVSGGLFGGELLRQNIHVGRSAEAEVRTPSATVVHAARDGSPAMQAIRLAADPGATLLYLSRPLILLPSSMLIQVTEINVGDGATVIIRDGFLAHDPEPPVRADRSLRSTVQVQDAAGCRVAIDRLTFSESHFTEAAPGVAGKFRAFGSVWLVQEMNVGRQGDVRSLVDDTLADHEGCYGSATALREGAGAVARVAAHDGGSLDVALDALTIVLARFAGHDRS